MYICCSCIGNAMRVRFHKICNIVQKSFKIARKIVILRRNRSKLLAKFLFFVLITRVAIACNLLLPWRCYKLHNG